MIARKKIYSIQKIEEHIAFPSLALGIETARQAAQSSTLEDHNVMLV